MEITAPVPSRMNPVTSLPIYSSRYFWQLFLECHHYSVAVRLGWRREKNAVNSGRKQDICKEEFGAYLWWNRKNPNSRYVGGLPCSMQDRWSTGWHILCSWLSRANWKSRQWRQKKNRCNGEEGGGTSTGDFTSDNHRDHCHNNQRGLSRWGIPT